MSGSVFVEAEFFVLAVSSLILPIGIYAGMLWKRTISRKMVLFFAVILIVISGVSLFLLQRLAGMARISPSLLDDGIFASEVSVALYLLPALFAGIGVNMLSHILITHLSDAERAFDRRQR